MQGQGTEEGQVFGLGRSYTGSGQFALTTSHPSPMQEAFKSKLLSTGIVQDGGILKVTGFLNHQVSESQVREGRRVGGMLGFALFPIGPSRDSCTFPSPSAVCVHVM